MGKKRIVLSGIVVAWLVIGVTAAWQRDYFSAGDQDCGSVGSTLVTIAVGPLNYVGVNPKVDCPDLPEPSE